MFGLLSLALLGALVVWNLSLTSKIGRLEKSVYALTGGPPAPQRRPKRRRLRAKAAAVPADTVIPPDRPAAEPLTGQSLEP